MSITVNIGSPTYYDASTPVNVVASAYDTSGNGGRKVVVLSNGWVVAVTTSASGQRCYVNKLDGNGFVQLCTLISGFCSVVYCAVTCVGTRVFWLLALPSGTNAYVFSFDATTVQNIDLNTQYATYGKSIDAAQNAFSGVSITAHTDGTLHAAWASKHSTYPNSFNIRYRKSTDGGATWATVTQITTLNTSGYYYQNPCVVVTPAGLPVIMSEAKGATYWIYCQRWTGSAWVERYVCDALSYATTDTCATVAPDGTIHVVWIGFDATDTAKYNVRYSKSTDSGASWTAPVKLTSGNSNHQSAPTVACDANSDVYVVFRGTASGTYTQIRQIVCTSGVWGSITNITSQISEHAYDPQTVGNFYNFTSPLVMWEDGQSGGSVKFRGVCVLPNLVTATPYVHVGVQAQDVSTPVNVIGSGYATDGNGGRRVVTLSNGWVVTLVSYGSVNAKFFVDKRDGNGPVLLAIETTGGTVGGHAMCAVGNTVHYIFTGTYEVYHYSIDVQNYPLGSELTNYHTLDSAQTAGGACSVASHTDGTLHACWASKNSTYPNSYNIRYSKSTDGGVTWAAVTYVTGVNNSGQDYTQPSIVVKSDGNPVVVFSLNYLNSIYRIIGAYWSGSAWVITASQWVCSDSYAQNNPCATVAPNGAIRVVWHGTDATESGANNVRFSESTDGAGSWSTPIKITTGNTYGRSNATIAHDASGDVYVYMQGHWPAVWTGGYNILSIKRTGTTWGTLTNVTSATANQLYPSICDNYKNFTEPLCIWQDNQNPSVKFRGVWYGGGWKPATVFVNTDGVVWKQV